MDKRKIFNNQIDNRLTSPIREHPYGTQSITIQVYSQP